MAVSIRALVYWAILGTSNKKFFKREFGLSGLVFCHNFQVKTSFR
jgi:hypothetical protein